MLDADRDLARRVGSDLAEARAAAVADAPASFKVAFIDELYRATGEEIAANPMCVEEA